MQLSGLSPRENEVASLLATGASYADVADALDISIKNVQLRASTVYRKLGLSSKIELAVLLTKVSMGLIDAPEIKREIRLRDVFGGKRKTKNHHLARMQSRYIHHHQSA